MDNTWVKLYRKIADHEILHDPNCLKIFIWLLTRVDRKTGNVTIGRFIAAEELRMNPNTFYSALTRLEKKYKMTTHTSNNKFTTISLLNWAKYQLSKDSATQDGNNGATTAQQPDNTIQEDKNKEYIDIRVTKENVRIFLKDFLYYWNLVLNTKYQTIIPLEENAFYWMEHYTGDQVYQAVKNIPLHDYWKDKMIPTLFFRRMNPRKEKVDYIGEMFNLKKKTGFSEEYRVIKA